MTKIKKKFRYGTFKDILLILINVGLIFTFFVVIGFCAYVIMSAPNISKESLYKDNSTTLYDINGEIFAQIGSENREKITYNDMPEVLIDAIVATEDSRFFQHNGIDIARFIKASIGQFTGQSNAGGGSTLTMQVSKNTTTSTTSHGIKGIIRKFQDIYLSVFVFEKKFTKEEIMEFYVNIPNLGAYAFGVQQASKNYFGKDVSELTLVEAATIAGLFQAPSAYNPYAHPEAAEARRNTVLNLMYRHGYISEEERDAAKAVPMESLLVGQKSLVNKYQDFIDTVVYEVHDRTGLWATDVSMKIWTTMNPKKQDVVNGVITGDTYNWKNDAAQAGIAVIDVKTGAIAAVGASRDPGEFVKNYATSIKRHPGSVAKPVVDYGPAFEYLDWSTGTTVIDDVISYTGGGNIRNFDSKFKGIMTVKKALAESRNVPALFTFQQTTSEQKLAFSKSLGWEIAEDGNGNVLESCSIGGFNGISPLQAATAYATFARGGTYIEPYSFTKLEYSDTGEVYEVRPEKHVAMSEETAFMINMVLKYAVTSKTIRLNGVSGTDLSAKTGTSTIDNNFIKNLGISKKVRVIGDSWQVNYSPDYAIATWYGYPETTKEHYLTSSEGSAQRRIIANLLVKGIIEKNSRFEVPNGIISKEIELETDPLQLPSEATPENLRATEYFKKGTVPTEVSNRFQTLQDPSNLRYSSTSSSVTLTWDRAPLPDAVNQEYLQTYFNESVVYQRWSETYYNNRIKYNNNNIGSFGYQVYLVNSRGTTNLGFTTNNTFTANVTFDSDTKFIVKSSYQKFKENQSPGISVIVEANSSNIGEEKPNTPISTNYAIEYIGPSCSSVNDFLMLGNSAENRIRVSSNGIDVTSKAKISESCYDEDENEISCQTMDVDRKYKVIFTIRYNGSVRNKSINLKPDC